MKVVKYELLRIFVIHGVLCRNALLIDKADLLHAEHFAVLRRSLALSAGRILKVLQHSRQTSQTVQTFFGRYVQKYRMVLLNLDK